MAAIEATESDKRELIQLVGAQLNAEGGRKKFYSSEEVEDALKRLDKPVDIHCWAFCFFCTAHEFAMYHERIGEICDYAAMKAELTSLLTEGGSASWFDVDLSWLDWPDFDFSSFFDFWDFF